MKLIVQGKALASQELKALSDTAGSRSFVKTGEHAWRWEGVSEENKEQIQTLAASFSVDAAILPQQSSLSGYKLLAMDMDSTFITIECIDEIADFCGLKAEVAAITESSMRGEIDFNESLTRRVALLKGLDESSLEKVYAGRLRLSPGAETMLASLKKAGVKTLLVSGGFTFFTDKLKAKYGLDFTHANTLEIINGKLTGRVLGGIVNAEEKANTLLEKCALLGIKPEQAIAMGDGANDLKMMQEAGLSIAYHAKPKVKAQANVALDYVGLEGVIHLFG